MASMFGGIAAGYATARPAVHPVIIERLKTYLASRGRVRWALDVGCGSGLSTRALAPLVARRIGIEPAEPMLHWSAKVDPGACFSVARAESLPFRNGFVDLITAAGSLNYINLNEFFPEAVRVLAPGGVLAVYDFSQGTRSAGSDALETWFAEFRRRYPPPQGHARPLDPKILSTIPSGFVIDAQESFEVSVPMTAARYVDYLMTETNVADAERRGEATQVIRQWCATGVGEVFQGRLLDVLFPAYLVCMLPASNV